MLYNYKDHYERFSNEFGFSNKPTHKCIYSNEFKNGICVLTKNISKLTSIVKLVKKYPNLNLDKYKVVYLDLDKYILYYDTEENFKLLFVPIDEKILIKKVKYHIV